MLKKIQIKFNLHLSHFMEFYYSYQICKQMFQNFEFF